MGGAVDGYRRLFERIRTCFDGALVYIRPPPTTRAPTAPVDHEWAPWGAPEDRVRAERAFQSAMAEMCAEAGVPVADLHGRVIDGEGALRVDLTEDGVHLSGASRGLVLDALEDVVGFIPSDPAAGRAPPATPWDGTHGGFTVRIHALVRRITAVGRRGSRRGPGISPRADCHRHTS